MLVVHVPPLARAGIPQPMITAGMFVQPANTVIQRPHPVVKHAQHTMAIRTVGAMI